MSKNYKPKEFAELLNVSVLTLQRWDNAGKLKAFRRPTDISTIIVTHKDRFIRFGFEWFERFLEKFNVKIVVVNNESLSPSEELVQDIISILHVLSCRIYGLRKYKKKIKEDEEVEKSIQNRD